MENRETLGAAAGCDDPSRLAVVRQRKDLMKQEIWNANRIRAHLKTGIIRMCVREKIDGKDKVNPLSFRTAKALEGNYVVEINRTEIIVVL